MTIKSVQELEQLTRDVFKQTGVFVELTMHEEANGNHLTVNTYDDTRLPSVIGPGLTFDEYVRAILRLLVASNSAVMAAWEIAKACHPHTALKPVEAASKPTLVTRPDGGVEGLNQL